MKDELKFFFDIAERVSEQSTCRTTHHGAIITISGRIVAEGWNSPPPNMETRDCPRCNKMDAGEYEQGKDYDKVLCTHAEVNAIITCARYGIALARGEGYGSAAMYSLHDPCPDCAKLIVSSGIRRLYLKKILYNNPLAWKILRNNVAIYLMDKPAEGTIFV